MDHETKQSTQCAAPPGTVWVRPALAQDDADIGELLVAGFVSAYARKMPEVVVGAERRAELRAVASKRAVARVWVAELEGLVVGTVALYPPGAVGSEAWLPNAADLRHLATAPAVQGRGYAGPLLDAAERDAFESCQAKAICLHVRRGNFGVARLYQRRGYQRCPEGDFERPGVALEAYALRRVVT